MSAHHSQHGQEKATEKSQGKIEETGQDGIAGGDSAENAPSQAKDQGSEPVPEGEGMPSAAAPSDNGPAAPSTAEVGPAGTGAEDLAAQLAETRDQLLRRAADFENFRKRVNHEKQMAIEYANQSLLLDIIPIIDDFERALQAAEGSRDFATFLEGVTMIEKRLTSQLESKWGLKRFNSAGEPFDPNRHEALMVEKSPDVSEAIVQEDLIRGYSLKDRVIRAAKVKVLMPGGE